MPGQSTVGGFVRGRQAHQGHFVEELEDSVWEQKVEVLLLELETGVG